MSKIILQINSVINSGSTGRIAEEIGQTAITQGWVSYIAYGRNEQPSQSQKIRIGTDFDVKLHGLQTRIFDNHGLTSKKATKTFIKKIEKINPDIIHLHNIHGYYLNVEILFNYLSTLNTPIVWTLHDCWGITGHCSYFSFVGCEKWKVQCKKCPQKKEYPASLFLDNSFRNFKTKKWLFTSVENMIIVPVSNWLSSIVKESFLNKYPINVIHNGVDTEVFKPRKTDLIIEKYNLKNKFVILGVANIWDRRKGLNDFLKLATMLQKDECIILVGLNRQQIKSLPSSIIGIERTENVSQLAELYSCANLYVNPTWEDNFPTTNLEAMACGTPVVTYNTGGSPEALSSQTGFVVEQGNLKAIRIVVDTVKLNRKSMYSEACRERALALFDKNQRYAQYIELYKKLLDNKKLQHITI